MKFKITVHKEIELDLEAADNSDLVSDLGAELREDIVDPDCVHDALKQFISDDFNSVVDFDLNETDVTIELVTADA